MSRPTDVVTFVLIPGAWCGPWAWDEVIPHLGGRGAVAVDLRTTGTDPAALGDLAADAAHVSAVIDDIGGPVVICGHSYGGMVVNELADHPAVRHSIYLTAFWPAGAGESLAGLLGGALPPWIIDQGDGTMVVSGDPATARDAFMCDVDEARTAAALAKLRPQAAACFVSPSSGKTHAHPTTYVICEQDGAIPPAAQEAMSVQATHVVRLDAAHFPQLSQPAAVAEVLLQAAREVVAVAG